MTDKQYWKTEMLDAYNDYTAREFNSEPIEASWPEDGVIGLAYTTYEFEEKYFFEHVETEADVVKEVLAKFSED